MVDSFLGTLIITEGGLWGKLTGVSVSVVAVFVIFGAILNVGEAGRGLIAAHSLLARILLVAVGILVILMRTDLLAVS